MSFTLSPLETVYGKEEAKRPCRTEQASVTSDMKPVTSATAAEKQLRCRWVAKWLEVTCCRQAKAIKFEFH